MSLSTKRLIPKEIFRRLKFKFSKMALRWSVPRIPVSCKTTMGWGIINPLIFRQFVYATTVLNLVVPISAVQRNGLRLYSRDGGRWTEVLGLSSLIAFRGDKSGEYLTWKVKYRANLLSSCLIMIWSTSRFYSNQLIQTVQIVLRLTMGQSHMHISQAAKCAIAITHMVYSISVRERFFVRSCPSHSLILTAHTNLVLTWMFSLLCLLPTSLLHLNRLDVWDNTVTSTALAMRSCRSLLLWWWTRISEAMNTVATETTPQRETSPCKKTKDQLPETTTSLADSTSKLSTLSFGWSPLPLISRVICVVRTRSVKMKGMRKVRSNECGTEWLGAKVFRSTSFCQWKLPMLPLARTLRVTRSVGDNFFFG